MDIDKKKRGASYEDETLQAQPRAEDEEFAEKMYEEQAPVSEQFDDEHEVSATGGDLREGTPSGVDAPPPTDK